MTDAIAGYCKLWFLERTGPRMETFSSLLQRVQHAGKPALLKCLKAASDEQAAAAMLAWYDGDGAVRLLRADGKAQLLEWIDGPPLSELVRDGEDDDATQILGGVVARLHRARPRAAPDLERLAARMAPLLACRGGGDSLHDAAARLAAQLLASTAVEIPLHGDIHHDNILRHADHGWLAIDPKGLLGDPHYDLANALCNPYDMPEMVRVADRVLRMARDLASRLALDAARLLDFALCHACLAEIWSGEDGEDPTHWRRMARLIDAARRRTR